MPCPKCQGALIWKERSWTTGGEDPGHWSCIMCGRKIYPGESKPALAEISKTDDGGAMSNRLNREKEEEITGFLKDHSVREIIAKTGVAKNTILRIRDETFTEEERAELKKQATMRGGNKRKLKKGEPRADLQNEGGQEIMIEEKICTKCGIPKPITEFNKNAARPSGRQTQCRVCTAQAQRDYAAGVIKKMKGSPSNGRKKRQSRNPGSLRSPSPNPSSSADSDIVSLDKQLALDVKAIKKRVAGEIIRMIQEAFA